MTKEKKISVTSLVTNAKEKATTQTHVEALRRKLQREL